MVSTIKTRVATVVMAAAAAVAVCSSTPSLAVCQTSIHRPPAVGLVVEMVVAGRGHVPAAVAVKAAVVLARAAAAAVAVVSVKATKVVRALVAVAQEVSS